MSEYDTLDELYLDLLNRLLDAPVTSSRIGNSQEILGWTARLLDPRACFCANPERALPPFYPAAELAWYLAGDDTLPMITTYAPRYAQFANEGVCHGAYGKRWTEDIAFSNTRDWLDGGDPDESGLRESERASIRALQNKRCMTQIATIIQILGNKPDSRQAVMTGWNAGDLLYSLAGTKNDIPCTLSLQFLLRDGKLNLVTTMRSNDVWLGVPNDFFCFCHLQMIVATALRVELGWYQHNVGSMHLYERDKEKAMRAAQPREFSTGPLEYVHTVTPVSELCEGLKKVEAWNREKRTCYSGTGSMCGGDNNLFAQLAYMMATKFSDSADSYLINKVVKDAAGRTRKG